MSIPEFSNTEEAEKFGSSATREQCLAMVAERRSVLTEFCAELEKPAGVCDFVRLVTLALRSQFLREAGAAARDRHLAREVALAS